MAIETSATQQSRRPRHNPENNNPIDNGRENLHSIIELGVVLLFSKSCFFKLFLIVFTCFSMAPFEGG
jgi:hypothetical protein